MKILFITELFPPYAPGGAEWSNYNLANKLVDKQVKVVVLTPNYGEKYISTEATLIKYPFYKKYTKNEFPGNFSLTNPLWVVWSFIFILITVRKTKPDIIHIQGKYSIAPSVMANLFFKKPLIATIRDYVVVCSYGECLLKSNKACNFINYFAQDFMNYFKKYVTNKNLLSFTINFLFALYGRASKNYLKFFVNRVDLVTCMSFAQKDILERNSISVKKVVIRNTFSFSKRKNNPKKIILFIGRLTHGKGVPLLLKAIKKIDKQLPGYHFYFIGKGSLAQDIIEVTKENKRVKLIGYVDQKKLDDYYSKAQLVVVPSIWPEPFSRVIVEALLKNVPVVCTKSGGLREAIKDGVWGYYSLNQSRDLAEKITKAIKYKNKLRTNISKDMNSLRKKYTEDVVRDYINTYKELLK